MGGAIGEEIILCRQHNGLDPIEALHIHQKLNPGLPEDALCGHVSRLGSCLALSRRKFLQCCNEIWEANGLPPLQDMSFALAEQLISSWLGYLRML